MNNLRKLDSSATISNGEPISEIQKKMKELKQLQREDFTLKSLTHNQDLMKRIKGIQ